MELETRLRDYGLRQTSWMQSLAAFTALTGAPIAYAVLPLVQRSSSTPLRQDYAASARHDRHREIRDRLTAV